MGGAGMPSESGLRDALKKEGGCGILIYLVGAIMVGGFIYGILFGFGDDPQIKKIQDNCWDRETFKREKQIGSLSESDRLYIVQRCDAEVQDYLKSKRHR
jgi:hypothetical protein